MPMDKKNMKPEKSTARDGLKHRVGDKIERLGEKISRAGFPRAGRSVYRAGNKIEHADE